MKSSGSVATFNQEVRLSGHSSRLNWLVGGSYDSINGNQEYDFAYAHWTGNRYDDGVFATYYTGNHDKLVTRQRTYAG